MIWSEFLTVVSFCSMRKICFQNQLRFVQPSNRVTIYFPPIRDIFFLESLRDKLRDMYDKLYSSLEIQQIPMRYEEISQLVIFGQIYISLKSRSRQSAAVMAIWPGLTGLIGNVLQKSWISQILYITHSKYSWYS